MKALLAVFLLTVGSLLQQRPESPGDSNSVRFTYVDLHLDPAGRALAAWQLELVDPQGRARIVGIEGGAHPAFAEPAAYDPQALHGGRVILAAFSLEDELPAAPTRVARVHLEVQGSSPLALRAELHTAAGPDGVAYPADLRVEPAD